MMIAVIAFALIQNDQSSAGAERFGYVLDRCVWIHQFMVRVREENGVYRRRSQLRIVRRDSAYVNVSLMLEDGSNPKKEQRELSNIYGQHPAR